MTSKPPGSFQLFFHFPCCPRIHSTKAKIANACPYGMEVNGISL
jgi:hypothetical protein